MNLNAWFTRKELHIYRSILIGLPGAMLLGEYLLSLWGTEHMTGIIHFCNFIMCSSYWIFKQNRDSVQKERLSYFNFYGNE